MKYALQLYGQLRTFATSLPSLLKFIDYYNNNYHVYLFIDKGQQNSYIINSNPNYSEENMKLLESILIKERIKSIIYTDQMSKEECDKEYTIKCEYDILWSKFEKKYHNITRNEFVCALKYRTYLLNNMRIEYEKKHTISYDYIVRSRFDYASSTPIIYNISKETTPILFSDALTIGSPEFVNKESELGLCYPFTPRCLFDDNCNLLKDKYKKYENWRGDKFIDKQWIFMPELNQRLFLLENSYRFIEAWWEIPCNYGFKIVR